jgi:O-antigen/teichoic acid export membrane protein
MFVIMLVNLYAVRLVLRGLGEMDYGIFNSIAGVVTMSACIASTLSVAIQRFYSIALGRHSHQELRETFSLSVNIVLLFCLIIFVVFQTAGLWFVSTQLVIPAERMSAALWIYQFSLAVLLLSILQIPFLAAIFAHEHMGIYAVVSTIECLL